MPTPVETVRRASSPRCDWTLSIDHDWTTLWMHVNRKLKSCGYAHSTRRFYRQVLRQFARHAACPPSSVDRNTVLAYLRTLGAPHCSPYWTAMNLSVLRTVFDKICGFAWLCDQQGPRIPRALPEILNGNEVFRMLEAAPSLRDRMILGLLFGCGLKVGELRGLRWGDVDVAQHSVTARSRFGSRTLVLPKVLVPILAAGVRQCPAQAFVLAGAAGGRPLSARWIQVLVRRCAETADILKPVTAMTLRHSYAVQSLEAGSNVREVQECLGHRFVQSTMRYLDFRIPALSPLDFTGALPPPLPVPSPATALASAADTLDANPFLAMAQTAREFLSTFRMQLGLRLFAPHGENRSTGPP